MRRSQTLAILLGFLLSGQGVSGHESPAVDTPDVLNTSPAIAKASRAIADQISAIRELDRFNGTWEKQYKIFKSEWSPEEESRSGTMTAAWILDGKHLQVTEVTDKTYMTIYSYDFTPKVYRASVFSSGLPNDTIQMTGQWDAQSSTFTWTREMGDGVRIIETNRFDTPDNFKFQITAEGPEKTELFRLEGTATRCESKKE